MRFKKLESLHVTIILGFILTSLTMNVNAQSSSDLRKYNWYVDFAQMGDTGYIQLLRQKYPHKINEEKVEEVNVGLVIDRLVYSSDSEFIVLEKREWDWGGVFYLENGEKLSALEYLSRQNELINSKHKP